MFAIFIDMFGAITFPSWIDGELFSIGPLSVKWYGISWIIGIYAAYFYAASVAKRRDVWIAGGATRKPELIPSKLMLQDLMFYCLLGIIIGGRLGFILFYSTSTIWTAPLDIFKVWQGGMSFHGGFLGACAAVIYMKWRKKLDLWRIADVTAIGAPLGLLSVRLLGNFVNQELYGRVTDVPWGFIFSTAPDSQPRHPSQLYEAFLEGIVIFLVLRFICTRYKALTRPGICAGAFIFMYGLFRFLVEFVREPDAEMFGPLTRGMTYSLPMVFIGLAIVIWAMRRSPVSPKRVDDAAT
jgi:phosphatidylglycerol:prolipoprotein diacylglycerol transferase